MMIGQKKEGAKGESRRHRGFAKTIIFVIFRLCPFYYVYYCYEKIQDLRDERNILDEKNSMTRLLKNVISQRGMRE